MQRAVLEALQPVVVLAPILPDGVHRPPHPRAGIVGSLAGERVGLGVPLHHRQELAHRLDAIVHAVGFEDARLETERGRLLRAGLARTPLLHRAVVRPDVVAVDIVHGEELLRVPLETDAAALQHIDDPHLVTDELVEPDDRRITHPDVPRRPHRLPDDGRVRVHPPGLLGLRDGIAVVRAGDVGIEVAVVLLPDDGLGFLVAALVLELLALAPDGLERDGLGVLDRQHLPEPVGVAARVFDEPGEVVPATRGRDEDGPAAVLCEDGTQERPGIRVGHRVLGEHHAHRGRSDEAVVVVAAYDLPGRAVLEPDEHVLLTRRLAQLGREGVIDAPAPGMRVHRVPDGLPGLVRLREHVPDAAYPRHGRHRRPVQGEVVLARSPVPRQREPLLARLERTPRAHLVRAGEPAVRRQFDVRHPSAA